MPKKRITIVVDTSAFESGVVNVSASETRIVVVEDVLKEIQKLSDGLFSLIQEFVRTGLIEVLEPSKKGMLKVLEASEQLGEKPKLSGTDLKILALAYDLLSRGEDVIILTNDLSIQNVAAKLGIVFSGQLNIARKRITWMYYCPACGLSFDVPPPDNICPRCGHVVKRKPKSGETIKRA